MSCTRSASARSTGRGDAGHRVLLQCLVAELDEGGTERVGAVVELAEVAGGQEQLEQAVRGAAADPGLLRDVAQAGPAAGHGVDDGDASRERLRARRSVGWVGHEPRYPDNRDGVRIVGMPHLPSRHGRRRTEARRRTGRPRLGNHDVPRLAPGRHGHGARQRSGRPTAPSRLRASRLRPGAGSSRSRRRSRGCAGPGSTSTPVCPSLCAGMAGSNHGWAEAGYLDVPADLGGLAEHLTVVPAGDSVVHLVPGLRATGPGPGRHAGRGGAARRSAGRGRGPARDGGASRDALQVGAPRRHRVTGFTTAMTGELYGLLMRDSILARLATGGPGREVTAAFTRGLEAEAARGTSVVCPHCSSRRGRSCSPAGSTPPRWPTTSPGC